MRQTGRTSRIVDFAVDQLFSVGNVLVTDHIAFEYPKTTKNQMGYFIDRVKRRILESSHGRLSCEADIVKIKDFYAVHFVSKTNDKI